MFYFTIDNDLLIYTSAMNCLSRLTHPSKHTISDDCEERELKYIPRMKVMIEVREKADFLLGI